MSIRGCLRGRMLSLSDAWLERASAPRGFPPDPRFWRLQAHKCYKACGYWVKCMFTSATSNYHKLTSATRAANIGDSAWSEEPLPESRLPRTNKKLILAISTAEGFP